MLGRLKMGPELASWYTQISPGRSIATLAAATAPPAPSGSTDMRAGCSGSQVRRGSPGDLSNSFSSPAPSAQSSKTTPLLACALIFLPYNSTPHARPPGSADLGLGLGAGGWGPLLDTPSYSTSKMKASRPQKSMNSLSKTTDFTIFRGGPIRASTRAPVILGL